MRPPFNAVDEQPDKLAIVQTSHHTNHEEDDPAWIGSIAC